MAQTQIGQLAQQMHDEQKQWMLSPASSTDNIMAANTQLQLDFLNVHTPDEQKNVADSPESIKDAIMGDHMELSVMSNRYGKNLPAAWLVPQLLNLSEFCGCKEKLKGKQLEELADMINMKFHYLKYTELLYFFFKFKAGDYGIFYGTVDPLKIMFALHQFVIERNEMLDRFEREDRERKKKEDREKNPPLSPEEFRRLVAEGKIGNPFKNFINKK